MNSEKTIIGQCPLCGGNVVKTSKGYACENSFGDHPPCSFFLFSTVGNRRFSDAEATQFLFEKKILLDGFAPKESKNFTSLLMFNPDGTVNITSQIGTCPKCHGILYVGSRSVSCGNFKHPERPCHFTIWRNIGGHELSLAELESLINVGTIAEPVDTFDAQGNSSKHRLALNENKEVVRL